MSAPIDLDKAAAELVANWGPISPESMARIAGLVRPTVIALTAAKTSKARIPRQRQHAA